LKLVGKDGNHRRPTFDPANASGALSLPCYDYEFLFSNHHHRYCHSEIASTL
jgi:hypothetical protein